MSGQQNPPNPPVSEEQKAAMFNAIKGGLDPTVDMLIKQSGANPDAPLVMTYKEFAKYMYLTAGAAAQATAQGIKKAMDEQEEVVKEYIALEFQEDFKKLDKCLALGADIEKIKARLNLAFKYLDKHDKQLNPDNMDDK